MSLNATNEIKHEVWLTDPSQMNKRIQDFWSTYWNRDSEQDQIDEMQWNDSIHIIESTVLQQPEINIPVVSLDAWR